MRSLKTLCLWVSLLSFSACSQLVGSQSVHLSSSCGVSTDQTGSFLPPLGGNDLVDVTIDEDFLKKQRDEIIYATRLWNQESRRVRGRDFFKLKIGPISENARPGRLGQSDCEFEGSKGSLNVIREESPERWSALNLTDNNGGATVRCTSRNELDKQVVVINTRTGSVDQFLSVVLHEMGHVIGLGHSCSEEKDSPDYALCQNLDYDHPYRMAALYPTLTVFSGSPEIRESLRDNDQERANCLYGP